MMIWITLVNVIFIIHAKDLLDSDIERKINATLQTPKISETDFLLDPKTFISDNGVRRMANRSSGEPGGIAAVLHANASKGALRMPPRYNYPKAYVMKNQMLDIIRQTVYSTQERMMALDPIMEKYRNDPSLRMAFIYNKLRQLIIDMRRLYTLSYNSLHKKRVYEQIYWYAHVMRKYFDVLYIVEHVIDLFKVDIKLITFK